MCKVNRRRKGIQVDRCSPLSLSLPFFLLKLLSSAPTKSDAKHQRLAVTNVGLCHTWLGGFLLNPIICHSENIFSVK